MIVLARGGIHGVNLPTTTEPKRILLPPIFQREHHKRSRNHDDGTGEPLRESTGQLAVRSLGKAEDGQPKFRRLLSQSGKPTRLQQSIKLCDRDEEHKTKNALAVLILAQRLDQQMDSWEADADKADG